MAAIRYYVNKIDPYNLEQTKRPKEMGIVKEIVKSNKYEALTLYKIRDKRGKQRTGQ